MWLEILVGFVVGAATYFYLHYLNRKKMKEVIRKKAERDAVRNSEQRNTVAESAEWLNYFTTHWYLFTDQQLQEIIKKAVQPILDDLSLPSMIDGVELQKVSFGQNPPKIDRIWAEKDNLGDDFNGAQTLSIRIVPVIDSPEFDVTLDVKGIGKVSLTNIGFFGELKITVLQDHTLPFPCIRYMYVTFEERPEIEFDIEWGVIGTDLIPHVDSFLEGMVEEILSDLLVNPGRFLLDMSDMKNIKPILIKGVRKLKRTILSIETTIQENTVSSGKADTKLLKFYLDAGAGKQMSSVEFSRHRKTHTILYPLAVLQKEKIRFKIQVDKKFGTDQTVGEFELDVGELIEGRSRDVLRTANNKYNLLLVSRAVAVDLPFIPIRQEKDKVIDYTYFYNFKNPPTTTEDVLRCPSGLIYLHVHRAVNLPIKDTKTKSSDPYVKVFLNGDEILKTKTIKKNLNPVFNHFEDFWVRNVAKTQVKVEVWDNDNFTKDDKLCSARIALAEVAPKVVNKAFPLTRKCGTIKAGEIFISVIFRPVAVPSVSSDNSLSLPNNLGQISFID